MCIEQKAPRGRPAKAKKALEYQAPVTQVPDTQEKKRGRPPKPKPVSEPEFEPITEPATSVLQQVR